MKTKNLLMLAITLISCTQLWAQSHPLVGTWEMVSIKGTDADGERFLMDTTQRREVKIITPTHYMLIIENVQGDSTVIDWSGAGTVRIEGNQYIEVPLMASDEEFNQIRTDFTWSVEGDRFIQRGTVTTPEGGTITLDELVFQRVSTDQSYPDNPSVGTWDQLSSSYTLADGTQDSHTNATATRFQIMTPTHWMRMNHREGKFESVMGGTYTLQGNTVYPRFEYGMPVIAPDATAEFTQRVEGDKMYVSGFVQNAEGEKTLTFDDVFQQVDATTDATAIEK
jgi:hypothetical protein